MQVRYPKSVSTEREAFVSCTAACQYNMTVSSRCSHLCLHILGNNRKFIQVMPCRGNRRAYIASCNPVKQPRLYHISIPGYNLGQDRIYPHGYIIWAVTSGLNPQFLDDQKSLIIYQNTMVCLLQNNRIKFLEITYIN